MKDLILIAAILATIVGTATFVAWQYDIKSCLVCFVTEGEQA